jgi:cytochrome c biogenesis protein CcmG, thiol:disulfide interchange protein DsbE
MRSDHGDVPAPVLSSGSAVFRARPSVVVLGLAMGVFLPCPLQAAPKPDVRARLVAPAAAVPGTRTPLVIELTVGPRWHVNSHTPSDSYLIPTNLALTVSGGTLSPIRYPSDVERRFEFSDKPVRVYEGMTHLEADLDLPRETGDVRVGGELSYQACNERQCFAPEKIALEAKILVGGGTKVPSASIPPTVTAPVPAAPPVWIKTLDGAPFSLDSLKGNVVVLDFWASWCAPCRASFPSLDALQAKYRSQGLRVIGLTLEDNEDAIAEFLEAVPVRFTIARDPSGQAGEAFGVVAMPTTFLLDRDGRIAARFEGGDRRAHEKLGAAVATLVSGGTLGPGADVLVAENLKATRGVKAWQRTYLADPIMELNGDPLTRLLREHVHSSKEGAAGDGGPTGGGCGCN